MRLVGVVGSLTLMKITSFWTITHRQASHISLTNDKLTRVWNSLILTRRWRLFFRVIEWWTLLFNKTARSLCFIDICLIIGSWIVLFSYLLLLLVSVILILTYALNIKWSHVLAVTNNPIICVGYHHFLWDICLLRHIVL